MVSKNIGTYSVGDLGDVSHFVAVPSQGPSVDVDPLLVPKAQLVPTPPPVYAMLVENTTTASSAQKVKGSCFRTIEPVTIDRVYVTTACASGDTQTFTLAEISGSTVMAIVAQVAGAIVGTGTNTMHAVTLPAPVTLDPSKRYAFLVHTDGKATNFGTVIRNGTFGSFSLPVIETGYITAVIDEPIVGSTLTVTASRDTFMACGVRIRP